MKKRFGGSNIQSKEEAKKQKRKELINLYLSKINNEKTRLIDTMNQSMVKESREAGETIKNRAYNQTPSELVKSFFNQSER